ncbi:MAG: MopE-related protein [Flavobacteriales bacterium]
MRRLRLLRTLFLTNVFGLLCVAASAQFTANNLVVLQVGDGVAALGNTGTPLFLREFTTTGTSVQTVNVPTTGSDRLVVSGSATSEGQMTRSADGLYLAIAGYDAAAGTTSVASAGGINRAVGYIDNAETWARPFSAPQTAGYNTNNIRSAYYDGTNCFTAGTATTGSLGGVRYWNTTSSSIQVSGSPTNNRVVNVFNGQLYTGASSGAFLGVCTVGSGIPTTTGNTTTLLTAPNTGGSSYAFSFNPAGTICYVADDRANVSGGIQRWNFVSGSWTLAYTLAVTSPANVGARGVCVDYSGADPVIYATTAESSANRLVRIQDTGSGSAFTVLATASTNTAFRSVQFTPVSASLCPYFLDSDGDGYGNLTAVSFPCGSPDPGYIAVSGDCNDSNSAVNPGASENPCNGIDDNCNGSTDEGFVAGCNDPVACNYSALATCPSGCDYTPVNWYLDTDGDGYGDNATLVSACANPGGYILIGNDCNDSNAAINPGASESICDGVDNNCNAQIDEGRVDGCTDVNALNFEPLANCNSGCLYPSGFTAGDLIVVRSHDGSVAPSSVASRVYLEEFNPSSGAQGAPVYSFTVPVTGPTRLTNSGTATSNLQINRSSDGLSVLIAGYDAAVGTAGVTGSASSAISRVAGELDVNLAWSRPVSSATAFNADNFRSVAKSGSNYWGSGSSSPSGTGGIQYLGTGTPTQVSGTINNTRVVRTDNGQLYMSTGSGTSGIYTVGSGLPTNSGNTSTLLFATGAGSSPYDFDFNDEGSVCYVADDRTSGAGGVQKWVFSAGVWSLSYTMSVGTSRGARSLYVDYYSEATPVIFAITNSSTFSDRLVRFNDTGIATPTLLTLSTAPANTNYRGVELAPCYEITWFRDQDGDGYGVSSDTRTACTQPLGYVSLGGDCNDSNADVNPGALEACNGIDDDCTGGIDNECVAAPVNNLRSGASNIAVYNFSTCLSTNGTVINASSSPQAQSTVITGEDVWYRFTASSVGVRVAVSSTSFDAVIELQDQAGNVLATENAVSGAGNEILNYYNSSAPLVSGQTYFIAVRNYNSGSGSGAFTICVQRIRSTACNSGTGPFQMCNNFKAVWVGASSYTFTFTNTSTSQVTVLNSTNGITIVPLGSLLPGFNYTVDISATFNLTDGAGNPEQIVINTPAACTITMAPHTNIELRSSDWCANGPKPINALVAANVWLCGAVNYEWRFRQTAPVLDVAFGAPIAGLPTNRFLNLGGASLVAGATYDVEIRPVFAGNVPGNWSSTARCLQIIGPSSAHEDNNGAPLLRNAEEDVTSVALYPNPNNGERVSLTIDGTPDLVQVRVLDATGREVNRTVWMAADGLNREVVFGQPLSPGIYVIELIADGRRTTERMIVQR